MDLVPETDPPRARTTMYPRALFKAALDRTTLPSTLNSHLQTRPLGLALRLRGYTHVFGSHGEAVPLDAVTLVGGSPPSVMWAAR